MTRRTHVIVNAVALAAMVLCAITLDRLWVPAVGVVCLTGLSTILRSFRKDESPDLLLERAAGAVLRLALPLAAIGPLVLLSLKDRLSGDASQVAYVAAYVVCMLLLIHQAFHPCNGRKHWEGSR